MSEPPTYQFHVQVKPRYQPERSDPDQALYFFTYTITVRNTGRVAAQLISRTWNVNDADGNREKVKGLGVVGQQPLLQPGQAFEYTSGCRLRTATGTMRGSFHFVTEEGTPFEVPV